MSDDSFPSAPTDLREDGLPPVSPDIVEQDFPDELDNIVPTRGYDMLPMVGLGGCAGSIPALAAVFQSDAARHRDGVRGHPPSLPGARVHAAGAARAAPRRCPSSRPRTARKWSQTTSMSSRRETPRLAGWAPGADRPGAGARASAWRWTFSSARWPTRTGRTRRPSCSPARMATARWGIKRIKERGGLTIAQDPDEAEHPSMPRTAIDTGMVDWVLQVGRDARGGSWSIWNRESSSSSRPRRGRSPPSRRPAAVSDEEKALREVLAYLRARTGRDFSYYKRATIVRRIARRMQVNGIDDLPDYLAFMRTHPGESGRAASGSAHLGDEFLPRPRSLRGAGDEHPAAFSPGKAPATRCASGCPPAPPARRRIRIAMLLLEHARDAGGPAHDPGLRHGSGRSRDRRRAGRRSTPWRSRRT